MKICFDQKNETLLVTVNNDARIPDEFWNEYQSIKSCDNISEIKKLYRSKRIIDEYFIRCLLEQRRLSSGTPLEMLWKRYFKICCVNTTHYNTIKISKGLDDGDDMLDIIYTAEVLHRLKGMDITHDQITPGKSLNSIIEEVEVMVNSTLCVKVPLLICDENQMPLLMTFVTPRHLVAQSSELFDHIKKSIVSNNILSQENANNYKVKFVGWDDVTAEYAVTMHPKP